MTPIISYLLYHILKWINGKGYVLADATPPTNRVRTCTAPSGWTRGTAGCCPRRQNGTPDL